MDPNKYHFAVGVCCSIEYRTGFRTRYSGDCLNGRFASTTWNVESWTVEFLSKRVCQKFLGSVAREPDNSFEYTGIFTQHVPCTFESAPLSPSHKSKFSVLPPILAMSVMTLLYNRAWKVFGE